MSFLFLMIKIALVIYVVKFAWNIIAGVLWLRFANKSEVQTVVEAAAKETK